MTLHTLAIMALAVGLGPRFAVATKVAREVAAGRSRHVGEPDAALRRAGEDRQAGGARGLLGRVAAMLAGLAVIYALGLAWLALFVPADRLPIAALIGRGPGAGPAGPRTRRRRGRS
jgi:biotin transport system substrate-specific component